MDRPTTEPQAQEPGTGDGQPDRVTIHFEYADVEVVGTIDEVRQVLVLKDGPGGRERLENAPFVEFRTPTGDKLQVQPGKVIAIRQKQDAST